MVVTAQAVFLKPNGIGTSATPPRSRPAAAKATVTGNRGGDRGANNALYTVVLSRLRYDPRTRRYVSRRTKEGLSKPEIIRCLKRYVAREIYSVLVSLPPSSSSRPPHRPERAGQP